MICPNTSVATPENNRTHTMLMRHKPPGHLMDKMKKELSTLTKDPEEQDTNEHASMILKNYLDFELALLHDLELTKLSYAILWVMQLNNITMPTIECICTLAILMDQAQECAEKRKTTFEAIPLETIKQMEPHLKELDGKVEKLLEIMDQQHWELSDIMNKTITSNTQSPHPQLTKDSSKPSPMNFAMALQKNLHQDHSTIISQSSIKTRQILIDKDDVSNWYPMVFLAGGQIFIKAKLAGSPVKGDT